MLFRKIVFWLHLVAGLISGIAIGIMCFTGTALAFEKQIVAWSERDARQISAPAPGQSRLALDELTRRVREAADYVTGAKLRLIQSRTSLLQAALDHRRQFRALGLDLVQVSLSTRSRRVTPRRCRRSPCGASVNCSSGGDAVACRADGDDRCIGDRRSSSAQCRDDPAGLSL